MQSRMAAVFVFYGLFPEMLLLCKYIRKNLKFLARYCLQVPFFVLYLDLVYVFKLSIMCREVFIIILLPREGNKTEYEDLSS